MRLRTILIGLIAWLMTAPAFAQSAFPVQSFDQMVASDLALIAQQKRKLNAGDLFFNPSIDNNARARATFTGQSRPLDDRRHAFIIAFASASAGNRDYADLYQREYLFRADGKDFWLPVQFQVATYFAQELSAGTPVTLYLRNAGGLRLAREWDWVFLVEEFEGPKPAVPAKPGAKPARPVNPAGPKTVT